MARKTDTPEKESTGPQLPPPPDLTFTEAEVQVVADFVNYVYKNTTATMSFPDARKVTGYLNAMHQHIVKMENYIFEHKRYIASTKAEK